MKIRIEQKELLNKLNIVVKFAAKDSTLPIAQSVLFEASENQLSLKCNNFESACTVKNVECQVVNAGKFCLPAKELLNLVKKLKGLVEFHAEDKIVKINNNYFRTKLAGLDAEEFPALEKIKGVPVQFTLYEDNLKQLIDNTTFAVSDNPDKPILTGVLFDLSKDGLALVATNGFRLAANKYNRICTDEYQGIIPAEFLANISKNMQMKGQAIFQLNDTLVAVTLDGVVYQSFLIEGEYPNWRSLFPQQNEFKTNFIVNREKLIEVLERVGLVKANSKTDNQSVKFSLHANVLTLSAESEEVGEAHEVLDCNQTGEDIEIFFNYSFLVEALSRMNTSEVELNLTTPTKAGIVKPVDPNAKFAYIVMPIRNR